MWQKYNRFSLYMLLLQQTDFSHVYHPALAIKFQCTWQVACEANNLVYDVDLDIKPQGGNHSTKPAKLITGTASGYGELRLRVFSLQTG